MRALHFHDIQQLTSAPPLPNNNHNDHWDAYTYFNEHQTSPLVQPTQNICHTSIMGAPTLYPGRQLVSTSPQVVLSGLIQPWSMVLKRVRDDVHVFLHLHEQRFLDLAGQGHVREVTAQACPLEPATRVLVLLPDQL